MNTNTTTKVVPLSGRTGNPIANQYEIVSTLDGAKIRVFQSYDSIIVKVTYDEFGLQETVQLDEYYWDYSRTTSKYRNQFLGMDTKEIKDGIKAGSIVLAALNK